MMQEVNDEFVNVSATATAMKSVPPCCLKSLAATSGNQGKYHATVVSGWFSQVPSDNGQILHTNTYLINRSSLEMFLFYFLKRKILAGEDMYFQNPLWPGINYNHVLIYLLCLSVCS